MARILAFSFFPASLPPQSGGELRLFGLYEALSDHHEITLLTSGELGGTPLRLQHNARFREIRVPKGESFANAWARLAPQAGGGDLSGPVLAAAAMQPDLLHEFYLELHGEADVIIHDSPFTAPYDLFMGFDGKPRLYNSYNVETDLYTSMHKDAPSALVPRIVHDCERRLLRWADLVSACSADDAARFGALHPDIGPTIITPNGVPTFRPPTPSGTGHKLVFIGSAHRPNQTAAALIRDVIAPSLGEYEFHIVGRCLQPGRAGANVVAHGAVTEAEKLRLLGSALACVNPMLDGGGSSLKMVEMAAHGVPVISTELGARGYDLVAGYHYSPIDPDDMVATVRRALADPSALVAQAEAAADHVARHFTWPQIARHFADAIDRTIDNRKAISAPPRIVVLNDYDPFTAVGGGATRIRGLYEGACEHLQPILLTLGDGPEIVSREVFDGRGLAIAIPKTNAHRESDMRQAAEHYVSTADFVAMEMAPANPLLMATLAATERFTSLVACEHPYMATTLLGGQRRFIYSSQNCEVALKQQLLAYHPRREQLMDSVAMIERFCVSCSELVVAVSDSDAATFAAHHDLVAPMIVVSNGAEEPSWPEKPVQLLDGFNACFLGSGHVPNHMAVEYLINHIAPELPHVTFHLAGSVCDGFATLPDNVRSHGRLDADAKTRLLMQCQLALNPMTDGSGSNVKVADYLRHGLKVLSTPFGARGYESLPEADLELVPLAGFVAAIERYLGTPTRSSVAARTARQKRYGDRFSMRAFGADYGAMVAKLAVPRQRALFVTYRYNAPPRGGGEYYVNRLVQYLADDGVAVDVLTPKVDAIVDSDRFASTFPRVTGPYPVQFGHPNIRVAKFETDDFPARAEALQRAWGQQAAFERALCSQLPPPPDATGVLWGWTIHDGNGRWTLDRFGMQAATSGPWRLAGTAPGRRLLVVRAGAQQLEMALEGHFDIRFDAPAGVIEASLFLADGNRPSDPRPLGLYLVALEHASRSLLGDVALCPWPEGSSPLALFHAHHAAAAQTRFPAGASLADLRGPHAPDLERYLQAHVGDYDLVITHNMVFRTTRQAIAAANRAGVPSIIVPHAHFEDDYYHFPDAMDAISCASRALVTPAVACTFLAEIGFDNIVPMSPGIDCNETFSSTDEAAFRSVYTHEEPFVLVAGRKAAAKGYHEVIAAVAALRAGAWPDLRLVMVGPDDDGLPISETFVDYLGPVDRPVLRGAYRACIALATMSRSESFGIVLLEAGLAGRPVVANADCAAFGELVKHGTNGFLTTATDLPDRLAELLADPDRANTMGENGRQMAQTYDWDQIGARFVAHCSDLMGRKGAPR